MHNMQLGRCFLRHTAFAVPAVRLRMLASQAAAAVACNDGVCILRLQAEAQRAEAETAELAEATWHPRISRLAKALARPNGGDHGQLWARLARQGTHRSRVRAAFPLHASKHRL